MIKINYGIVISAILAVCLTMPIFVSADEEPPVEDPVPDVTEVVEPEPEVTETLGSEPDVTDLPESDLPVTTQNEIVQSAVDDVLDILDNNSVLYDDDLKTDMYDLFAPYVFDDNTEYVVESIRTDLQTLITEHITTETSLLYTDEIKKDVDSTYDKIFTVTDDQQDVGFGNLIIIGLISAILVCSLLSYFVM